MALLHVRFDLRRQYNEFLDGTGTLTSASLSPSEMKHLLKTHSQLLSQRNLCWLLCLSFFSQSPWNLYLDFTSCNPLHFSKLQSYIISVLDLLPGTPTRELSQSFHSDIPTLVWLSIKHTHQLQPECVSHCLTCLVPALPPLVGFRWHLTPIMGFVTSRHAGRSQEGQTLSCKVLSYPRVFRR